MDGITGKEEITVNQSATEENSCAPEMNNELCISEQQVENNGDCSPQTESEFADVKYGISHDHIYIKLGPEISRELLIESEADRAATAKDLDAFSLQGNVSDEECDCGNLDQDHVQQCMRFHTVGENNTQKPHQERLWFDCSTCGYYCVCGNAPQYYASQMLAYHGTY